MVNYWIVDVEGPEIIAYRLTEQGVFLEIDRVAGDEVKGLDAGPVRVNVRPGDLIK